MYWAIECIFNWVMNKAFRGKESFVGGFKSTCNYVRFTWIIREAPSLFLSLSTSPLPKLQCMIYVLNVGSFSFQICPLLFPASFECFSQLLIDVSLPCFCSHCLFPRLLISPIWCPNSYMFYSYWSADRIPFNSGVYFN